MKTSRRTFLSTSFAALSAASVPYRVSEASPRGSSLDPWIEVHTDHLKHNAAEVSRRVGGRPILAVIKNNGYGLGIANVARILEPLPAIQGFAVIKLQEAVTLRDEGIQKPILLMGPFTESELKEIVAKNITPMVYTPLGDSLEALSASFRKRIPIHLCVDTGIGRVGVPHREALPLIRDLAGRTGVKIDGIMMTFAEDLDFDHEQHRRFERLCGSLQQEGIEYGKKHSVSSFGLFQHPDKFLDMVRPGMALFGVYSESEFRGTNVMDLKPAVALKTRVAYVKQLQAGDSAGYNRVYAPGDPVWIATLPIGHADGVPRAITKGGSVRIGRDLCTCVAISASHLIVEIGPEQRVSTGDVATVFDWQDGSRPEDLASSFGGSVYDLTMHLNPLNPRRLI